MERHLTSCFGTLQTRQRTSTYDLELRHTFQSTREQVYKTQRSLNASPEHFASACNVMHQAQHLLLRGLMIDVDAESAEAEVLSVLGEISALLEVIEDSRKEDPQLDAEVKPSALAASVSDQATHQSPLQFLGPALRKSASVLSNKLDVCRFIGQRPAMARPATGRDIVNRLHFLNRLGEGGVGRVFLAERVGSNGELVAVKVISKQFLHQTKTERYVWQEMAALRVLGQDDAPFVAKLHHACALHNNLFFVLEYLPGDLSQLLKAGHRLAKQDAQFYLAELVLAIEFCHARGVAHRDIKPANLLLTSAGHLKLIDFGLSHLVADSEAHKLALSLRLPSSPHSSAQGRGSATASNRVSLSYASGGGSESGFTFRPVEIEGRWYSPVGTHHYLAPEIVVGCGHNHTVDWWSIGVLAFQMLTGALPFDAGSPDKIQELILENKIKWPGSDVVDRESVSFIKALLCSDVSKRLGAGGAAEVKAHPFFQHTAWEELYSSPAPFVPPPREHSHDICDFSPMTGAFSSFAQNATGDGNWENFFFDAEDHATQADSPKSGRTPRRPQPRSFH